MYQRTQGNHGSQNLRSRTIFPKLLHNVIHIPIFFSNYFQLNGAINFYLTNPHESLIWTNLCHQIFVGHLFSLFYSMVP